MRQSKNSMTAAILAALLFLALSLPPGAHAAKQGTRWAIVVGINKYMKEVTPLRCAENDALQVKNALMKYGGFSEDNIFLLTSDQKGNRMPDKGTIVRWLSYIKQNAKPDDLFVFFFSGHGMDMEKESFLLTMESDPYSRETLEESSLKVSNLRKYLEEMPAAKKLLFIDACRNDPRSGKGEKDNLLTDDFAKRLKIRAPLQAKPAQAGIEGGPSFNSTFFSCSREQRSYEWSEKSMGFFTYYLVDGMKGSAADEKGNVTLHSLDSYLGQKVASAVKRERGSEQRPFNQSEGSGGYLSFVLSRPGKVNDSEPHGVQPVETPVSQNPVQPAGQGTVNTTYGNPSINAILINMYDRQDMTKYSEIMASFQNNPNAVNKQELLNYFSELTKNSNTMAIVNSYIQNGWNVNEQDTTGGTLLHHVAMRGDMETAKLLIKNGANINAKGSSEITPLYMAVSNGQKIMALFLIEQGADCMAKTKPVPNTDDLGGHTPLHVASAICDGEVVKAMLDKGADVNVRNSIGSTPLHNAAEKGNIDAAKILLQYHADINAKVQSLTPLQLARAKNQQKFAEFLQSQGARE
ncbi:MAG: ankyrin repeat domain-containing protein [Candidatus Eremiobacteraeota bacterium]|nr:ankyrin repeat domain-containing protein [Candidatus Eremiobacteraeota bacterium]